MSGPALADYQWSIGTGDPSDIVIGRNTNCTFSTVLGTGAPDTRSNDLALGNADGEALPTVEYKMARVLDFRNMIMRGSSPTNCHANLLALEALWTITTGLVVVRRKMPGVGTQIIEARSRGFDYDEASLPRSWVRIAPAVLKCPDPAWVLE